MRLFKSNIPNTFHFVTTVTYNRVPVFKSPNACEIFTNVLREMREHERFKLVGYVVMPDHVHLIINPQNASVIDSVRTLKSLTARRVLDWLAINNHHASLAKLELAQTQKRQHAHAVWQKDYSAIDLWSPRFINQKLDYIHLNPVRAGLCQHPAKWRWSSYRAYLPHEAGDVPMEVDWRAYWEETSSARTAGGSPPLNKFER